MSAPAEKQQFLCGCEIWIQDVLGVKAFMYKACPDGRSCRVYAIVKEESEKVGNPFVEVEVPP